MTFADKQMELENIMLSEISQAQKNQRLNIFSDKSMTIYNNGGQQVEEKNDGTLDFIEKKGVREGGNGKQQNETDSITLYA